MTCLMLHQIFYTYCSCLPAVCVYNKVSNICFILGTVLLFQHTVPQIRVDPCVRSLNIFHFLCFVYFQKMRNRGYLTVSSFWTAVRNMKLFSTLIKKKFLC